MSYSSATVLLLVASALSACASDPRKPDTDDGGSVLADAGPDDPDGGAQVADDDVAPPCAKCGDGRRLLHDGWSMEPSFAELATEQAISSVGFATDGWYPVSVPTTVFAGLVANGEYPDPYYGDNLLQDSLQIPLSSWWYRTEFTLDGEFGPAVFFGLDGINYRANVWLNGQQIATADEVVGTFTAYEWNVSAVVHAGINALAIEILPPDLDNDLAISWFDWNPAPPDLNMGIWQSVYLKECDPIALRDVSVTSQLNETLSSAELTIRASLVNTSASAVNATVSAQIEGVEVTQEVALAAHETKDITLDSSGHRELTLDHPRLWWPAQLGRPELYELNLSASVAGRNADSQDFQFGIRDVKATLDSAGHLLFSVNGKRILIRGAGYSPDMLLREDPLRLDAQFRYVRDLGLNTIRLEGKFESDAFYQAADRYGIMVIAGWMCCDHWQDWDNWSEEDHRIASASLTTQAKRLRNHPSVIDFLLGSDEAPPPRVESESLEALQDAHWPNPITASAADRSTPTLGPSGVKMSGPYDWIAPSYWLLDTQHGGAFGFSTEVGPGPSIPELETIREMLDPEQQEALWTRLDDEHFHAGTNGVSYNFGQLHLFNQALSERHGAPRSLSDYVMKAQLMNYEAERAPFEAYGRNKYRSATGIVHWLLNSAWPSLIWNLYSYDLSAAGAYFGAKKGNEPLHIMYSYDDRSVVVLNHTQQEARGLEAEVQVYNLDGSSRFANTSQVDVAADSIAKVATIPALDGLSATYFVALKLSGGSKRALGRASEDKTPVSHNFYWLSTKPEQIDFENSDWFHSPTSSFADYTALDNLPQAALQVSATSSQDGEQGETAVTLTNNSRSIAFFTRLVLKAGKSGKPVLPVLWQDNYLSLVPGETRTLKAKYVLSSLEGSTPVVEVSGFNQPLQVVGD